MPPFALAAVYGGAVLAPAILAVAQLLRPVPFLPAFSAFVGLAALVMLFVQFVTSGRFEVLAGRIGLDVIMGFHRFAARALVAALFLHVALAGWLAAGQRIAGLPAALFLMFQARGLLSGLVATILLVALVRLAVRRDCLGVRYELWRASHGAGAVVVLFLALDHAWRNGSFLQMAPVKAALAAGTMIALIAALFIYVVRGWQARTGGWIVERVRSLGGKLNEITLRQVTGPPFRFRAGQFVWITFGRRHPITDHPFSIASPPHELPLLRILVKENGDFTGTIGRLAAGTQVCLDGPHGNFVAGGRTDAVVLIAGGVGIAPVIGILRHLSATGFGGRVALLVATRNEQEQVFHAEIGRLSATLDLVALECVEDPSPQWLGAKGRVDLPKLQQVLMGIDPASVEILLCGPVRMMAVASEALIRLGVPLRCIRYERFDYHEASDPKSRRTRAVFITIFSLMGAGLLLAGLAAAYRP